MAEQPVYMRVEKHLSPELRGRLVITMAREVLVRLLATSRVDDVDNIPPEVLYGICKQFGNTESVLRVAEAKGPGNAQVVIGTDSNGNPVTADPGDASTDLALAMLPDVPALGPNTYDPDLGPVELELRAFIDTPAQIGQDDDGIFLRRVTIGPIDLL